MKTLQIQLGLAIIAHTLIYASESDSKQIRWGAETNGVQLGISLAQGLQATNGGPVTIKVHIKNNSTNNAQYYIAGKPVFDPSWSLTVISPSGKDISPKPLRAFAGSGVFRNVNPGQTAELEMDLKSKASIDEIGEYKVALRQKILVLEFNDFFEVSSDTLVVRVVKSPEAASSRTNSVPPGEP